MVNRFVAVFAAVTLLAGCARVHPCDPSAATTNLEEINRELAGRTVVLTMADGSRVGAWNVSLSADSLFMAPKRLRRFGSPKRGFMVSALPTSVVHTVTVRGKSKWRGAVDGALVGLGVGVILGTAWGLAAHEPGNLLSEGESASMGGVLLGVIGSGVGAVFGFGIGSTDAFDLTRARGGRPGSH